MKKKEVLVTKLPKKFFRPRKQIIKEIDQFLEQLHNRANVGLHLGAGNVKIEKMINCDMYHPSADLKIDAINLFSFENESVDIIETHHMIEHLSFKQTENAINEWHRVLNKEGLLILSCPDLTKVCMMWLWYTITYPIAPNQEKLDYIIKMFAGPQDYEGMIHKNAFDKRRLKKILEKNGFNVIFTYSPYPSRTTPSLFVIAEKSNKK